MEDLAMDPKKPSTTKHAGDHVALILGREFANPDFYYIDVPIYDKKQAMRVLQPIPVRLPHEDLYELHKDDPYEAAPPPDTPYSILSNPLLGGQLASGTPWSELVPISVYWDGVMYTKQDGFLGIFCKDYKTSRKFLFCMLRAAPPHIRIMGPWDRGRGPGPGQSGPGARGLGPGAWGPGPGRKVRGWGGQCLPY